MLTPAIGGRLVELDHPLAAGLAAAGGALVGVAGARQDFRGQAQLQCLGLLIRRQFPVKDRRLAQDQSPECYADGSGSENDRSVLGFEGVEVAASRPVIAPRFDGAMGDVSDAW